MSEKVKKSRYIGRVEVFAAKIEISELLAAGLPYAWIYKTLVKKKTVNGFLPLVLQMISSILRC